MALAFVRLAPADPAAWHQMSYPKTPGDYPKSTGFMAVRQVTTSPEGMLRAVEREALGTPRTSVFAGSIDEGMMTFETRSGVFGFPDYTTVTIGEGAALTIHGRLRFGANDLGVNKARITDWLAQLGPLVAPLP